MGLADIFKLFLNYNSSQQQNNIPKEIMEQYPYGQFPSNNSKEIQTEHLKKILKNQQKNNVSTFNIPNANNNAYMNTNNTNERTNTLNTNSDLLNNIKPIISMMSNEKKIDNKNLLNLMLPLILGKNNQLGEIFNMALNNQNKKDLEKENEVEINSKAENYNSDYKNIESYEKI